MSIEKKRCPSFVKGGEEGVGFAGLPAASGEKFCLVAVCSSGNVRRDVPLLRTKQNMLELKAMADEAELETSMGGLKVLVNLHLLKTHFCSLICRYVDLKSSTVEIPSHRRLWLGLSLRLKSFKDDSSSIECQLAVFHRNVFIYYVLVFNNL